MLKYLLVALAFCSLVFFPYHVTLLLLFAAALAVPFAGIALGVTADALYFAHGLQRVPTLSILGLVATIAAIFLRRFVRTHITQVSSLG